MSSVLTSAPAITASLLARLQLAAKWAVYPGLDLNTRDRYRKLPAFFRTGPIDTLDAGCGNGALSYAAYKRGNRVLGVTFDSGQVMKARGLFAALRTDPVRLRFEVCNLYDLPSLDCKFDQIICSETLEHITDDKRIVRYFYDMLRPGGVLHLCCPYERHPKNFLGRTNVPEDGGHVRDGYTLESYQAILMPLGFKIRRILGLGSPLLQRVDKLVRHIRNRYGDVAAFPLFLITLPIQWLDKRHVQLPYSLYVEAVKPW